MPVKCSVFTRSVVSGGSMVQMNEDHQCLFHKAFDPTPISLYTSSTCRDNWSLIRVRSVQQGEETQWENKTQGPSTQERDGSILFFFFKAAAFPSVSTVALALEMCAEVYQLGLACLTSYLPSPVLQCNAMAQGVQVQVCVCVGIPAQTAAVGMTQHATAPLGRGGDVEKVSAQRPAEILREAETVSLVGNERPDVKIFGTHGTMVGVQYCEQVPHFTACIAGVSPQDDTCHPQRDALSDGRYQIHLRETLTVITIIGQIRTGRGWNLLIKDISQLLRACFTHQDRTGGLGNILCILLLCEDPPTSVSRVSSLVQVGRV